MKMNNEMESSRQVTQPTTEVSAGQNERIELIERHLYAEFKASPNYTKVSRMMLSLKKNSDNLISHYEYLQSVVKLDPGNAGSEGELEFATFLKNYLPNDIEVHVGGKVILENGMLSPQIDLILTKDLPLAFAGKYFPHEYVVAAFEVKMTLEKRYIKGIADTAALLRPLPREGSPCKVLYGRIIYGVLALSSNLKGAKKAVRSKTLDDNEKELHAFEKALDEWPPAHPSQAIDLVLVADAFFIGASKTINYSEKYPNEFPDVELCYYYNLSSGCDRGSASNLARLVSFMPRDHILGAFFYRLALMLYREGVLSWRSPQAFYDFKSNIATRRYTWPINILGEEFRREWVSRVEDESHEWSCTHPGG